MKYKKIMMLAIFIVSLLAISAASAADNTTEVIIANAGEDVVSVENNNLTVEQTENEETIGATDDGTFTALQNKIKDAEEGSTITLEKDYFYDEGFKSSGISISKSVTIDGNGHTIDALGKSRIFFITADGVVLNNITFCNGYGKDYDSDYNYDGGAVLCSVINGKNILISNCSFINNSATVDGGAVCDKYSGTVIKNCIFRDNYARAVDRVYNIVNCTFVNNYGAISYANNVVNCTFVNNYNRAIYYIWDSGIIENCIFKDNSAGAIDTYSGGKIVNCSFVNNSAGSGGAIYCKHISVYNSEFVNNSAGSGGAIYSSEGISVFESEFVNNSARYGGAIFMESFHQYFRNNIAYQSGHSLHINGNSKFANNIADYGGAICIDKTYPLIDNNQLGDLSLTGNVTFDNNTALVTGSAVYMSYIDFWMGYKDNGDNVSFINNHGTVIFLDEILLSDWSKSYSMENANFNNNNGPNFGGAISVNEDVVSVKFYSSYTGKASGYIGRNFIEDFNCVDGLVQFNLNDYNVSGGKYRIIVSINDGDYHASVDFPITVESKVFISASDVTKYCGGPEKLMVSLTENGNALANKNVDVTVNGKTSTVKTDSKGQASIDLNLPVGDYDVTATYEGVSTTSKVTVKSTLTTADATGTYLNSKVSATFSDVDGKDLASKRVTFKAGDKTYTATTNSKGIATADVDLEVGTYTVTAINPVNNEQKQFKLVIDKASSAIALDSKQINGVTTLTATLTPATATGNVVFNVNGEEKSAPIKNGKATLTLSDLEPGDYNVTASYSGDKNLNASTSSTVTFNVAEVYPILAADPVTKTYGTSTKLVVNLADSKGNAIADADVSVVIGSATTHIKTDSNGQATMAINKAPGTYTATITYADAQTTAKINVKKATPKLTAKAKTFKKSLKTKKYTVTLKTNTNKVMKNTKVTLKVNGKTYKATTNTKGQATFKITKLTKKGKFTAVVKYAGGKYYNAKTVKAKITVK